MKRAPSTCAAPRRALQRLRAYDEAVSAVDMRVSGPSILPMVGNSPSESFQAFVERVFEFIDENEIEKLIIDMRWNNGGNALLLPPLIRGLVRREKIDQTGNLFVIVGRYTFSAATNAAALIEQQTNAVFVGEPTPSGPNYVGESNIIALPYSQVRVSISDNYWQHSWTGDTRVWIAPLLYVPHTFAAYQEKRDLEMEAILAYPNDRR